MQPNKGGVSTATFFLTVPSGSRHTTCKTVVDYNPTSSMEEVEKSCSDYTAQSRTDSLKEKFIGNAMDASNLQYCELSNISHRYHCISTNSIASNPFTKVGRIFSNALTSSKPSLRKAIEFSTSKTSFLFMCLMIALLFLCVEGAPVSKIGPLESSSPLVKKRNSALAEFRAQDTEIASQETKVIYLSKMTSDTFSIKIKRSLGKRNRPRKGGKRKGGKRKQPKVKRPNKKSRQPEKPNQKPTISLEDVHQRPSHHDLSASPRRQRLYNKIGQSFHLVVGKKGKVSGEPSFIRSDYSVLEIKAVEKGGKVAIMGVKTKKYICVTKRGAVKARKKYKKSRCQFIERILSNKQNTYESLSCTGCFLNINKKGKVRKLRRANPKLTKTHFLPLRMKQSPIPKRHKYLSAKRGKVVTVNLKGVNGTSHMTKGIFNKVLSEPNEDKFTNDDAVLKFDVTDPERDVTKASGRATKSLNHRTFKKLRKNRKNVKGKKIN